MKNTLHLTLLFISLLFASWAQKSSNWYTYKSDKGHYTLYFPGKPSESEQDIPGDAAGLKIHLATYAEGEDVVFMSSWTNLANTAATEKTTQQALEDSRDGAIESMKATDVKTSETVTTGDPYIDFTFSLGTSAGRMRIYFVNGVQYSLIVLCPEATKSDQRIDKFIRSYKHI
jgi:hypothetical protein